MTFLFTTSGVVISELRRLRQEDEEFETSWSYIASSRLA
jgi:hypothetical protein